MSSSLLAALKTMKYRIVGPTASDFDFQHRLCYDFESLIWVTVYAMMIHQRNIFAATDSEMFELYKEELDDCWAAHAYKNIFISHNHMVTMGCTTHSGTIVSFLFPNPRETAFFCAAMRLIRDQGDGDYITYERICKLFRDHIDLDKKPQAFDIVSK